MTTNEDFPWSLEEWQEWPEELPMHWTCMRCGELTQHLHWWPDIGVCGLCIREMGFEPEWEVELE